MRLFEFNKGKSTSSSREEEGGQQQEPSRRRKQRGTARFSIRRRSKDTQQTENEDEQQQDTQTTQSTPQQQAQPVLPPSCPITVVTTATTTATTSNVNSEDSVEIEMEIDLKLQQLVSKIVVSMKKAPSSLHNQRKNLFKLKELCPDSTSAKSLRCMHHLLHQGGMTQIVAAMQKYRKSTSLQLYAIRILTVMAKANEDYAMLSSPAISRVLDVIQKHKRNVQVVANGFNLLTAWAMASTTSMTSTGDNNNNNKPEKQYPLALEMVEKYDVYPIVWKTLLYPWVENQVALNEKALKVLVALVFVQENRADFVTALGWRALVASLRSHASNAKIQIKGLKVLKYLANDYPQAVAKRMTSVVVPAMLRHRDDARVQKLGCQISLLLTNDESESCTSILMQPGGGRDCVVQAMQQHPSEADIQKLAILVLQKLPSQAPSSSCGAEYVSSTNTAAPTTTAVTVWRRTPKSTPNTAHKKKEPVDTGDAITQGLEAMVKRLMDPTTPASTCTSICKGWISLAMQSHVNKLDIGAANGLHALILAMERYPDEASLQRYACQCLCHLTSVEDLRCTLAHSIHKGLPTVVKAIQNHSPVSKSIVCLPSPPHVVALHGILTLVRLAQRSDYHAVLMACQTVPALVKAMKAFPHHVIIQQKSMSIMNKIAISGHDPLHIRQERRQKRRRYAYQIVLSGGLKAVLLAMKNHADNPSLQRTGCCAITNLHYRATSSVCVKAGGMQAVLTAMKRHPSSLQIQIVGLKAFEEVTQYSHHLQTWALELQGLEHLMQMLQLYASQVQIQSVVYRLILKTTQKSISLRTELVNVGGIPAVLKGMRETPHSLSVQQDGFQVVYNLSQRNPHYGAIIIRHGGWKIVRRATMLCRDHNEFVHRYGFTLLVKLWVLMWSHWMIWIFYHAA